MIEARNLSFETRRGRVEITALKATDLNLACVGALGALCRLLVDPQLPRRGTLLIEGQRPEESLRSGKMGYVPRVFPLSPQAKIGAELSQLEKMRGRSPADLEGTFERLGVAHLWTERFARANPLEVRRIALALALASDPKLLVFEDPFEGLTQEEGEEFFHFLIPLLNERAWVGALSCYGFYARAMIRRAHSMLQLRQLNNAAETQLLSPESPSELSTSLHWLILAQEADVSAAFITAGIQFMPGSAQGRYLVRDLDFLGIARICSTRRIQIEAYYPADEPPGDML